MLINFHFLYRFYTKLLPKTRSAYHRSQLKIEHNISTWNRLLKGSGAQGFSRIVQTSIRLAEVPLLLSFWGQNLYGEWLILSTIPSYLSIADVGFSSAACREMTIKAGAGDKNSAKSTFQSTWVLLIVVSIAVFTLSFVFVRAVPSLVGFTGMNNSEIRIVLLLLIIHLLVNFQCELLNGAFWVSGHYPFAMYSVAFTQLLEFLLFSIIVALGGRPVHAATGYLAGKLLGTGFMWLAQYHYIPWLRHGLKYASLNEIKRLISPSVASLAFPLGNALNIQGTRLAIGMALGPSALSIFVPLRTLSRMVMQPGLVINRLIEPELAMAFGSGNSLQYNRIFLNSCQLAFWGSLVTCLFIGPCAYWIFPIWTDGVVALHWPIYLTLLLGVQINSTWYTALMVPFATNCHGRIAWYYSLVYGISVFITTYVFANKYSILGASFSLLMAEIIMAFVVIKAALLMTNIDKVEWAKKIIRPPFYIFIKLIETHSIGSVLYAKKRHKSNDHNIF